MSGPRAKLCGASCLEGPCERALGHDGLHATRAGTFAWGRPVHVDRGDPELEEVVTPDRGRVLHLRAGMGYVREAFRALLLRDGGRLGAADRAGARCQLDPRERDRLRALWDETLARYVGVEVVGALRYTLGDVEGDLAYEAWAEVAGLGLEAGDQT